MAPDSKVHVGSVTKTLVATGMLQLASAGRVLCFVDADTIVPEQAVGRVLALHELEGRCLVLYRLVSREPGIRAWLWWSFWGLARHLPLARAKSMPAFMSCNRTHFESYGPFKLGTLPRGVATEAPWHQVRGLLAKMDISDAEKQAFMSDTKKEVPTKATAHAKPQDVKVALAAKPRSKK